MGKEVITIGDQKRLLERIIAFRDPYLSSHHSCVTYYSELIAQHCYPEMAAIVSVAASFHDVGKIGIPDSILFKPGPLDDKEWNQMRLHPVLGAQLLENGNGDINLGDALPFVILAVRHHHERLDGSGYPDGLKYEDIPIAARIIAIADAYDAMTTDRPYRKGFSKDVALREIIRCSGHHFDPVIVDVFLQIMINEQRKNEQRKVVVK